MGEILSIIASVLGIVAFFIPDARKFFLKYVCKPLWQFICYCLSKVGKLLKAFYDKLLKPMINWFVDKCKRSFFFLSSKKIQEEITSIKDRNADLSKKIDDYFLENVQLKDRVEKIEKVLKDIGSPLNSYTSIKNWDIAEAGDRQTLMINGVEFAFRYCPTGKFTMGGTLTEEGRFNNKEQHVEGFWICEVPTTQEQWEAVGSKKDVECCFKGVKRPVENVTWLEVHTFIAKLNELNVAPVGWRFNLPTEEQWEYACRTGTSDLTYIICLNDCAWHKGNSRKQTHDVGCKQPNKWGIFDMLGNVWELSSACDLFNVVCRGGSWKVPTSYCRPATRRSFERFTRTTEWVFVFP